MTTRKPVPQHYGEYLKLDTLLAAQQPVSRMENGKPAHDEMLFITVHQAYELWFQQILHECTRVREIFDAPRISERGGMAHAADALHRVVKIQQLIAGQLDVLETMTSMDFLDFRDDLFPASGFQSVQFRVLENTLGLREEDRYSYGAVSYKKRLTQQEVTAVDTALQTPSLFELVERWLARTPFLKIGDFTFWAHYKQAVETMFSKEEQMITQSLVSDEEKKAERARLKTARSGFDALFEKERHASLVKEGHWRLGFEATQAALLIFLYRDEPILQQPHRILSLLMDIDENLTHWRFAHALMAQRMLGSRVGTGGSSGYAYLSKAAEMHRVYKDFFALATYLIPRKALPPLPQNVQEEMIKAIR